MSTQVILLERVEKLGNMGDVVTVKPGYARNYLLPQKKALRASKDNVAYFEAQKKTLEAENEKRKKEAEKVAKKVDGLTVSLIRQASEAGQLFGSVASRDIAQAVREKSGEKINRSMVNLNQNFKYIGLFPVEIFVHPEVKVEVTINVARSQEEADIQAETGRALIEDDSQLSNEQKEEIGIADETLDDALEDVLEEGALEAEKEKQAEAEAKAAEDAAKEEERAAKAAEKAEAKAAAEEAEADADAETAEEEKAE